MTTALLVLQAVSVSAHAQAVAGHVTFVNGDATRRGVDGPPQALKVGDAVLVGDRIHTAAQSHVHLRMVDQGFIALRPASLLAISRYDYAEQQPEQSRIRLDLLQGQSRAVSGLGGQSAKHSYRFNTPLAAIGLRGTDYTVQVDEQATRVSVAQGAVVVSPYLGGCAYDQLGPCDTRWTTELSAQMPHAYLEVSAKEPTPRIVPQQPAGSSSKADLPAGQAAQVKAVESEAQAAEVLKAVQVDKDAVMPPTQPSPSGVSLWGRWSFVAAQLPQGGPTVATAFQPAQHAIVGTNDAFVLVMPNDTRIRLPEQGQVQLGLAAADAYLLQSGQYSPARVQQGRLDLDFGQQRFATQLRVDTGAAKPETVSAQGQFNRYGQLQSNPALSNANVQGVVVNGGQEAAYLFDKPLANGAKLLGATQWLR